jgi:hypothetical protein
LRDSKDKEVFAVVERRRADRRAKPLSQILNLSALNRKQQEPLTLIAANALSDPVATIQNLLSLPDMQRIDA